MYKAKSKVVITPDYLAQTDSETGHQKALFAWAALSDVKQLYPELHWMFSVPNGGFRPKPIAAAMRAEGAKSGVLDICLPVRRGPWNMLWIELKRPKTDTQTAGKVSKEQLEWIDYFKSIGCGACVCVGWHEARETIIKYLEYK